MQTVLTALRDQQEEMRTLLAARAHGVDWQHPRAAKAFVADVVLHRARTNDLATTSALGRFDDGGEQFLDAGGGPAADLCAVAGRRAVPQETLPLGAAPEANPSWSSCAPTRERGA